MRRCSTPLRDLAQYTTEQSQLRMSHRAQPLRPAIGEVMDSHRVRAILCFVQAVDTGSFAAAGHALGVTSAAVSKNVATLEKALGVRLMNRTTRTLELTEEGASFLRQARVALEALDAAIDTIAMQRAQISGHVRIS